MANRIEHMVEEPFVPPTATAPTLDSRWMIARDIPAVLAIDLAGFPDHWDGDTFRAHLRRHNRIGIVATDRHDHAVLGFAVYQIHKDHLSVLRLAVAPGDRLRGIGRALLEKIASVAVRDRLERVEVVVPEGNLGGQLWLKRCGLYAVQSLRGWGEDGDGIEFERIVGGDWRMDEALNGRR